MAARAVLDIALAASKALVPRIGTAWQYAKVEMIPPMSGPIVHGPLGKQFENAAANFGQGIVSGIQGRIKEMDLELERIKREKEAAIKAAVEKAAAIAKAAQQAIAEEKKKREEAKAKEAAKPKEEKKPEAAAPKAAEKKDKPAKKKEPARKKEPKKNRRDDKKGKPPKK